MIAKVISNTNLAIVQIMKTNENDIVGRQRNMLCLIEKTKGHFKGKNVSSVRTSEVTRVDLIHFAELRECCFKDHVVQI